MINVVQHNMKTCVICTGIVCLALPLAIALNFHFALAMFYAKSKPTAWTIHDMHMKHNKLTLMERKLTDHIVFSIVYLKTHDLQWCLHLKLEIMFKPTRAI